MQRVTAAFVDRDLNEFALWRASHHLDEFEHISPWEQKIYAKLFFDTDPERPVPVERLLAHFDARFAGWRNLAVHYIWEDLFWRRQHAPVLWLERLLQP